MLKRYQAFFLLSALFALGTTPALAQDGSIGFEQAENCTPACDPGTTQFVEDSGLSTGSSWTTPNNAQITDLSFSQGSQAYAVGTAAGFSRNARVDFNDQVSTITFDYYSELGVPAGTAEAYNALDQQICVANSGSKPGTITFTPGTTGNCTGEGPIAYMTFVGGIVDNVNWTIVVAPVELTSFDATTDGDEVVLQWRTASETNNQGFEVQVQRAGTFEPVAFVGGQGTTSKAQTYSYRVAALAPGTHSFRLKQVDLDGSFSYSPVVEARLEVPGTHVLSDVYPNPFNPTAQFTLTVAQQQDVQVAVYDLLGREVARLFDGNLQADVARSFTFEAAGLPSGIYLVRAVGETFTATQQATLLK